jgi:hypothetical protein
MGASTLYQRGHVTPSGKVPKKLVEKSSSPLRKICELYKRRGIKNE